MENSDLILGLNVYKHSEENRTPPEDYGESDSPSENDWKFNSNYDIDPYYEANDSPSTNKDKQISSSGVSNWIVEYSSVKYLNSHQDICSSVDCSIVPENPYYENNFTPPEAEDDFILGINVDPYSEGNRTPQEDWVDYCYDYGYYEESDSSQEKVRRGRSYYSSDECLAVENEQCLLLRFYEKLVDDLMEKFSIGYFDVCVSLRNMICNHRGVVNGRLPSKVDPGDKSYCLGYLHRYAPCHSIMISDSISTILNSPSTNVLSEKLSKNKLNIMFLGGGPGNDFVGFLTALHSYHNSILDLDVTVVDKMSGWEDIFIETVHKLKESEYGEVYHVFDDVNITTSFISVDLKNCDEWSIEMQNNLKKADLLFLVKCFSHVPNHDKLDVLQNIILYMKIGALLIFVDSPYPYKVFASVSRSLRPVYKSSKKSYHLKAKMLKFGFYNITACKAEIRVFQRH
ncbi:unnamed protein product [Larinioides sclopetarius]|uniref:S-adenosyl-L-methionine-dependent methyltransferase n=1 Tax=Larinioides sclopetarius TaxID=280406 RepID=A0AAV1ZN92_9ARAC